MRDFRLNLRRVLLHVGNPLLQALRWHTPLETSWCLIAVLTAQLNVPFLNTSATAFELRVDGFDDETRCMSLFATNSLSSL